METKLTVPGVIDIRYIIIGSTSCHTKNYTSIEEARKDFAKLKLNKNVQSATLLEANNIVDNYNIFGINILKKS